MEFSVGISTGVALLLFISQVLGSPDYDPILQKLHETIEKTFEQRTNRKDIKIKHRTGKFFKYPLSANEDYDYSGSSYQVSHQVCREKYCIASSNRIFFKCIFSSSILILIISNMDHV